jgi:hypothetical protein
MLGHIVRMGIDEFLPFMLFQARFLINSYDDESCSYFYTFLFPSTALMPMEYCMPLMDTADTVENAEFVVTYREFVHDRTGVYLIIET